LDARQSTLDARQSTLDARRSTLDVRGIVAKRARLPRSPSPLSQIAPRSIGLRCLRGLAGFARTTTVPEGIRLPPDAGDVFGVYYNRDRDPHDIVILTTIGFVTNETGPCLLTRYADISHVERPDERSKHTVDRLTVILGDATRRSLHVAGGVGPLRDAWCFVQFLRSVKAVTIQKQ
jgi:hypothetical protein